MQKKENYRIKNVQFSDDEEIRIMITFFNKLGTTWAAKLIFVALALSMMAFWGLGGLTNLSSYRSALIEVGNTSLSLQDLSKSFEKSRQNFTRLTGGKYLSPAKAVEMGLLDQVIQNEVNELIRNQISEILGLTASNASVQKYVEHNPIFQDNLGHFDKNLFYAYLAQSGMSETQLAYALQKELAFKHLTSTVQELGYNSKTMSQLTYRFKNEKRDVSLLYLSPTQIKINEEPSEEDLKVYYESYSENFMKPEFRQLKIVSLTPEMMMDFIQIDQQEIDNAYTLQKDKYNKPEERDLYQMFFSTQEEAERISKEVRTDNFEQIALKKLKQSKDTTHFGYTPKSQLMEELATPLFKAKENTIVGPIESATGWHLFWVKAIKHAQTAPETQIKKEIKKALTLDKTYGKLEEISRQLEDILGEGKSLSQAANQLKLPIIDISAVDISGKDPQGNFLPAKEVNVQLLQNVFTLQKGDISELVENGNGYLIAEIISIDPVSIKPYELVKSEVKSIWLQEKQKDQFKEIVQNLAQKAKNGTSLAELKNTKIGAFDLIQKEELTRDQTDSKITKVIDEIFMQKSGSKNTKVIIPAESEAIISTVTRIHPANPITDDINLKVITENTKTITGNNMNTGLFTHYTNRIGVKINQKGIKELFSVYKTQE